MSGRSVTCQICPDYEAQRLTFCCGQIVETGTCRLIRDRLAQAGPTDLDRRAANLTRRAQRRVVGREDDGSEILVCSIIQKAYNDQWRQAKRKPCGCPGPRTRATQMFGHCPIGKF